MTTLNEQKTVGEIAAAWPASIRVFQKYDIDFCCGGKFSLADACNGKGISSEALFSELERAVTPATAPVTDWNAARLDDLIDHILARHHEYLKAELPRLDLMIAKVVQAHGENHPELARLSQTFAGLKEELEQHMAKEEMILFPMIKRMGEAPSHCGSIANPIRVMEYEHDNAGRALEEMRETTGDYMLPPEACNTYRGLFHGLQELEADLHQHIHLENNILFPRALAQPRQ